MSYIILILVQSHSQSRPLHIIPERLIQKIPGIFESEKPINIAGFVEVHLKSDSVNGGILISFREPLLFRFALDNLP